MVKKKTRAKRKSAAKAADAAARALASANELSAAAADADNESLSQQQRLLDHFAAAFEPVLTATDFGERLQEIKQALFERDFAAAFGRADYLAAYAARWSPTRALCYAEIFQAYLPPHLQSSDDAASEVSDDSTFAPQRLRTKMVCVGGCAAEHVAFASHLQNLQESWPEHDHTGELVLLDSAPWASIAATLQETLTTPLPLSKYASSAAKAASRPPFLQTPEQLHLQVLQQDALQLTEAQWVDILTPAAAAAAVEDGPSNVVVTLLFTLNELYANGGISKTTQFIKTLEAALPDQALLLVVDSPGSYSEAALGKDQKKYPMQWLLHHTLTDPATTTQRWTRLESHDSVWFRLSEELDYPIQLENMRYQLHLYRIDKSPSR